jgi:ribosomal-protein-alanine N-acetyltransferase
MMELTTSRLTLRAFTLDDSEMVAKLCHNRKIYDMTSSLPYPYTIDMAKSWIERHESWRHELQRFEWAIVHTQTNQLIGAIGLGYNRNHHHGEVGYWLGEPYWNQGYASEALQIVIKWAFTEQQYHRIYARHFIFNQASRKVMEKAGLTYEGTMVDHLLKNGQYVTLDCLSIINPNK